VQLERDVAKCADEGRSRARTLQRAEQLFRDRAGSQKAVEQAREELNLAENEMKAARERLERL
jgi:multidrug resistance efflux pump